jgi:hypothetical protein
MGADFNLWLLCCSQVCFQTHWFSLGAFAGLGKFSVPMVVGLAGLGKPSIWICVGETVEFTVCRQICSSSKLSRSER